MACLYHDFCMIWNSYLWLLFSLTRWGRFFIVLLRRVELDERQTIWNQLGKINKTDWSSLGKKKGLQFLVIGRLQNRCFFCQPVKYMTHVYTVIGTRQISHTQSNLSKINLWFLVQRVPPQTRTLAMKQSPIAAQICGSIGILPLWFKLFHIAV